jgi:hypothetical protein
MTDPHDPFLSDADLDQRWNRKRGYAGELRSKGKGPPHVRLSPRVVRYRLSDVVAYERRLTFESNAAAMVAADGGPPEAA